LKIETLRNDDCTATLTVEVDPERVQTALRAAAKKVARQYNFPGFRPGKAPYETVVRHVGQKALYDVALDDLGQKVYEDALDEAKLEVSAPGVLADAQFDPMVLKFTVPLKPEVDLGDYRARRLPYTAPVVDEAQEQKALDDLRDAQAVLEPVDRPAAMGDVLTVDLKAFLNEGENPSDYLVTQKDMSLLLDEKDPDRELPGLEQQLVGLTAGQDKKFDLTFAQDFVNSSLRGQMAHVEVKCKEVKHRDLPEWNDELAKTVGEFESLAALKERVHQDLQAQAKLEAERAYGDQVMDEMVTQAVVKYPPVLLENQLDALMEDLDQSLQQREHLKLADYLKVKGKTMEEMRAENRERAEISLKRSLVLSRFIELEDLAVDKDEVDSRTSALEAQFGTQLDEKTRQVINSDRMRSSMALDLLTSKAYARLVALARGEEVPLPMTVTVPVGADHPAEAVPETTEAPGAAAPADAPAPPEPEAAA
jgi:trigger factor